MESQTQTRDGTELEPWFILLGEVSNVSLQLWQVDLAKTSQVVETEESRLAIATFTDRESAYEHATAHSQRPWQLRQLAGTALVQLLATCYQDGIRYIALNPTATDARQVFVIRDILKSALAKLKNDRDSTASL